MRQTGPVGRCSAALAASLTVGALLYAAQERKPEVIPAPQGTRADQILLLAAASPSL